MPRVRWPRALMPADRGRYLPPAVAIPSPPAGCLVPGLPLPQAHRSREFTPPSAAHPGPPSAGDHAAGPPLTQARRIAADSSLPAAADPSPVDPVHSMARSAVCMSCCAHRNILTHLVGLVHGDSSGAGGSSCCGRRGHSSRLPPCRGCGCVC